MKTSIALFSLAGAALATAPSGSTPSGCSKDFSGKFEVTIGKLVSKRDVIKARPNALPLLSVFFPRLTKQQRGSSCGTDGILLVSLADGVLTDSKGRIGYIASNYQFQFDNPVQDGTIYDSGFSVCGNNTLALGSSTTWYQCKSGSFWNLYDRNWAAQCDAVEIIALPCDGSSASASGKASQIGDGQIIATELITTTIVKPLSDGQPQVITTAIPVPICQIGDGQIQGHSTPCASITVTADATTAVPVSQYSDGQIQVTQAATVPATVAATTPAKTTSAPPGTTVPAPGTTAPASAGTLTTSVKTSANVTSLASVVTGTAGTAGTVGTAGTTAATTTAATSSPSSTAVIANAAYRTAAGSFGALAVGLAVAFLAL